MDLLDFSDDDEEIIMYLSQPIAPRQLTTTTRSKFFEELSDENFLMLFRLSKSSALILLAEIEDQLKYRIGRVTAVSPINQLLCTLRFYGTGNQLSTCGDMIGAHESTACRIVRRVTHAIASLGHTYIKFPDSEEQLNELSRDFYKIAKFPRVIGAIGCTHVRIISPRGKNAEKYRNEMGYFSIKTQCVVAADLKFLNVVARWYGSAVDSNIWDNCLLKHNFLQGIYPDKYLLGDSGYAQNKSIITPLPEGSPSTRGEPLYQESHIKTGNVLERAFEVWKRRFPILTRGIQVHLHKLPGIIVATAVLHNLAIQQNEVELLEDPDYPLVPDPNTSNSTIIDSLKSNLEREILINDHFEHLQ